MDEKTQRFIEDTGMFFEQLGLSRMAGRIVGYLLICELPEQTMPDIVSVLQASKSAISTALWQLQTVYLITRFSRPGERRDYFRLADDIWSRSFQARMGQITDMRVLAEAGLALLDGESKAKRQRLELMRDMYSFMEREFPKLLNKWEEEKRAKGYT
jgi:DNA-binding transcriptional regulator GbsR (MarR family)